MLLYAPSGKICQDGALFFEPCFYYFPWAVQKPRYVSTLCVSWALIALNAASSEGFRKSFVGLDLPLVCVS